MGERTLTFIAVCIELGVPAVWLALMYLRPVTRKRGVVVLGAVSLPLLFYAAVVVTHVLRSTDRPDFAFYAAWVMTFAPYVAVVVGASILALVPRPSHLGARFLLGLASAPLSYYLFVWLASLL